MVTASQNQPNTNITQVLAQTAQARRGLAIFFAILIPLSILFEALIGLNGNFNGYVATAWAGTIPVQNRKRHWR